MRMHCVLGSCRITEALEFLHVISSKLDWDAETIVCPPPPTPPPPPPPLYGRIIEAGAI